MHATGTHGTGTFAALIDAVLDAQAVLFPIECAGCGRIDRSLCYSCARQLCSSTFIHDVGGTMTVSALRYDGVVRRVILAFKESGRTDLARSLSRPLRDALLAAVALPALALNDEGATARCIELCTIPPDRAAWRRRGYSPVGLLVRAAGFHTVRILAQLRTHDAQKSLGLIARKENLDGSLVARRGLSGRHFIIVDDIITTGATVLEARRAIEAAGGTVVCVVTVAYTPRHFSTESGS